MFDKRSSFLRKCAGRWEGIKEKILPALLPFPHPFQLKMNRISSLATISLISAAAVSARVYNIDTTYNPSDFLDGSQWSYFTDADPTHGSVGYQSLDAAKAQGLATVSNNAFNMKVVSCFSFSSCHWSCARFYCNKLIISNQFPSIIDFRTPLKLLDKPVTVSELALSSLSAMVFTFWTSTTCQPDVPSGQPGGL